MLTAHRRHLKSCEHAAKGWNYTLCGCPVWCDGILHGARITKSLHTRNWDQAMRRMQLWESGSPDEIQAPSSPTLKKAQAAFLAASRHRNLRESTIASYTRTLDHLSEQLGSRAVASIDVPTLDAYRAGRQIAPRTWRKELEHLRAFFAWCIDRAWRTDNPAKRLRMPRVDDLTTLPFTAQEITALLQACDQIETDHTSERPYIRHRARALVLTLLYSGLRVSDVAQLRRDALDAASGHLTLRVLKNGVALKVLLHPTAQKALETLPSTNPQYFFWTGKGKLRTLIGNMRRTIQRLGAIANVHAHPHRFRDTFAVELLTEGADIRTVQKLLGHESVRTTEKHYAHFVAAHQQILDSAAAKLDFTAKPARPVLMHPAKKRLGNP